MRVAVFGAAGWLGRAIIANMKAGHDVVAVDLSPSSWGNWNDIDLNWDGEVIHGDITDYTHVEEVISSCLLYTSPSPRDGLLARMPSSA